ncbi:hypothetical protein RCC89_17665 [Cytophagaceae bacterium ABcell3]|nr:hypothetical protein RCC89_17665 [Cytophagaceae bacterium ABcell3]
MAEDEKRDEKGRRYIAEISAASETKKHNVIKDEKKGEVKNETTHRNIILRKAAGAKRWVKKIINTKTGETKTSKEK